MPPAKKSTTAKTAAKKTTARRGPGKVTAAHKKAMAQGRTEAAAVNRYLAALHTPTQRGRKVSAAALRTRIKGAEERARAAVGLDRVLAHQELRDLRARLAAAGERAGADVKKLEQDFLKVARRFSERRGITHGAWRDAGVPAQLLKRAGIPRTRG